MYLFIRVFRNVYSVSSKAMFNRYQSTRLQIPSTISSPGSLIGKSARPHEPGKLLSTFTGMELPYFQNPSLAVCGREQLTTLSIQGQTRRCRMSMNNSTATARHEEPVLPASRLEHPLEVLHEQDFSALCDYAVQEFLPTNVVASE